MRHDIFFLYTSVQSDLKAIPGNVKLLIFGMFVYMLAWGAIDPFLSIFFHEVTGSYAISGFLYGLFFLTGMALSIPVGSLADKTNRIKFTVASMLTYPFIGILHIAAAFLAAPFSLIALVFGRVWNGIGATFWVMVEGFIRKESPKKETSETFGLFITFYQLAFVAAPLIIFPAVYFFGITFSNVYWLFLLLIPFPVLSAIIISRVPDKGMPFIEGLKEVVEKEGIVKKEIRDLQSMGFLGTAMVLIGFFMVAIQAMIFFMLPLYARSLNLDLLGISFLFAAISIPYLFSFLLAELADHFGKTSIISACFLLSALVAAAIFFASGAPTVFFIACILLGFIFATLQPAVNGLITDVTPRIQAGEMTGVYTSVFKLGGFAGAFGFGLLAETAGLHFPFLVFAVLLAAMAALTYSIRNKIVLRI